VYGSHVASSGGIPNSDTPVIRNQHSNAESITKQYGTNQATKRESENKQFNKVRQIAYVLVVEGRRSYSTNRVTRVTKMIRRFN